MKQQYAGKVAIRQVIECVRSCGIVIGGIHVARDGTIRILTDAASNTNKIEDDFDKWLVSGKLG